MWTRPAPLQATALTAIAALATFACAGSPDARSPRAARPTGASAQPAVDADAGGGPAQETLTVDVLYRERMRLPPTATVSVVLEDSARADAPAQRIASQAVPATTAPPYRLVISYDPKALAPTGRYTLRARIEDGERLLFTSTETTPAFGNRRSADEAPNEPIEIVVQRVATSQARPATGATLTGTRWQLAALDGKDPGKGAGDRRPFVVLDGGQSRVTGFAGCNQIVGSYQQEGDRLQFSQLTLTRKACKVGMDLEQRVSRALSSVRRHAISGPTLTLYSDDGTAVATFEAAGAGAVE